MYIRNRGLSLAWKIATALVCIVGLVLDLWLRYGAFRPQLLLYYTTLSNLLCLACCILAALQCRRAIKRDGLHGPCTFSPRLKGAVVLAITVTMLIYWVLLYTPAMLTAEAVILHLVVPIMMILDWLLFDEKGAYRVIDPLLWLGIPLTYYALALLVSKTGIVFASGGHFAYPFIDHEAIGWAGVARYIALLAVVFLVIGYLYFGVDRLLKKKA